MIKFANLALAPVGVSPLSRTIRVSTCMHNLTAVSAVIRIRSLRSGSGTRSFRKLSAIHRIGNAGRYTCQAKVSSSYSWLALLSYGCSAESCRAPGIVGDLIIGVIGALIADGSSRNSASISDRALSFPCHRPNQGSRRADRYFGLSESLLDEGKRLERERESLPTCIVGSMKPRLQSAVDTVVLCRATA